MDNPGVEKKDYIKYIWDSLTYDQKLGVYVFVRLAILARYRRGDYLPDVEEKD
jgi:hypothetical protein